MKKIRAKYYIAYGSNLNLEQMARRCPTAKVVGSTIFKNYRLVFRGGSHGPALVAPATAAQIKEWLASQEV